MTDELPERSYSAFVPVLILAIAFLVSYSIQLYAVISERSSVNAQIQQAMPNIPQAQAYREHYINLINDLLKTSQGGNANATQIVNELKRAGILRERPAGAAGTNAAPANP